MLNRISISSSSSTSIHSWEIVVEVVVVACVFIYLTSGIGSLPQIYPWIYLRQNPGPGAGHTTGRSETAWYLAKLPSIIWSSQYAEWFKLEHIKWWIASVQQPHLCSLILCNYRRNSQNQSWWPTRWSSLGKTHLAKHLFLILLAWYEQCCQGLCCAVALFTTISPMTC